MHKNITGKWEAQGHEEGRPIDTVEAVRAGVSSLSTCPSIAGRPTEQYLCRLHAHRLAIQADLLGLGETDILPWSGS